MIRDDGDVRDILKPGRYINREWNSVHKLWNDDMLKFALCFPDIYEIGMSHLGSRILYSILNNEPDIICERVFAPWIDMENKMRAGKEPLLSLETKHALNEFDIVGFSLQYEMNYIDVLNILDLGDVPIYAKDRDDKDPLVIAGGPCAFNPEVLADFIDAFVIGEAEEAILEVATIVQGSTPNHSLRSGSGHGFKIEGRRDDVLKELSRIKGVYVPAKSYEQRAMGIQKRIIKDLDGSFFPTKPIVPYIQIVHDRIGIEIMRGCPHKCRFCQACNIFHPFRTRSLKMILDIAESSLKNTGYEEISLLSLSSGDYPYIEELIKKLEEMCKPLGVKISLPSLRIESFYSRDDVSIMKRAGLTFAPEAGSERLRNFLDKDIKDEDIIQKSKSALNSGWRKVKMYFMIGLPSETYNDLDAIIELASQPCAFNNRQSIQINLSISPFIPKPHSGFEREGMDGLEGLKDKEQYLISKLRASGFKHRIRMDFHNIKMSRIEAILSRGDRKIAGLVFRVWQKGARLQAWTDCFNYTLWEESFQECGIDPNIYLKKQEETLPWDFVKP